MENLIVPNSEDAALSQIATPQTPTPQHIEALTNPNASPMSPLYDAYQQVNEGYAKFLTSPAEPFLKAMKNYNFDPKTQGLLTRGTNDNGAGAVTSGILKGWLNATSPELGTINAGPGKEGGIQSEWLAEGKAGQEAKQNQFKMAEAEQSKHAGIVKEVLSDPHIVTADTQIQGYMSLKKQMSDLANSGAIGADGKAIMTPIQLRALATTFLQMVRPGARVMGADGNIDSSALDALSAIPGVGQAIATGLKQGEAGTDITLEGNDLLGIAKAAEVIDSTAKQYKNSRIQYRMKNDPENAKYYNTLLEEVPAEVSTAGAMTPEQLKERSNASMKADAEENVEKKNVKAYSESIMGKKFPEKGTPSKDGKATADGKGGWIENPAKGK
jgi:hypothetical protein